MPKPTAEVNLNIRPNPDYKLFTDFYKGAITDPTTAIPYVNETQANLFEGQMAQYSSPIAESNLELFKNTGMFDLLGKFMKDDTIGKTETSRSLGFNFPEDIDYQRNKINIINMSSSSGHLITFVSSKGLFSKSVTLEYTNEEGKRINEKLDSKTIEMQLGKALASARQEKIKEISQGSDWWDAPNLKY